MGVEAGKRAMSQLSSPRPGGASSEESESVAPDGDTNWNRGPGDPRTPQRNFEEAQKSPREAEEVWEAARLHATRERSILEIQDY